MDIGFPRKFRLTTIAGPAFLTALIVLFLAPPSHAAADSAGAASSSYDENEGDDQVLGYDKIVNELNHEVNQPAPALRSKIRGRHEEDSLDTVWIHGGVGLTSYMESLTFADGNHYLVNERGVQAALGIDLLSENFMAEGTARSFGEDEDTTKVSLQEFDLKVLYKTRIAPRIGIKIGGGLDARYLTAHEAGQPSITYSTPSTVASIGIDFFLTDRFSFGFEIATRNAMIADTIDHSSMDGTLRMDTHF